MLTTRSPTRSPATPRPGGMISLWVCVCASLLLASPVMAQEGDDTGIAVGRGRFRPVLELQGRYTTNPGNLPSGGANDLVLIARPKLSLNYPTETSETDLNASFSYMEFLGLESETTGNLSSFMGEFSVASQLNKESKLPVKLGGKVRRSADPGNQTETARLLHTVYTGDVGFQFLPGGGALDIRAEYQFLMDIYDEGGFASAVSNSSELNLQRHAPRLTGMWKFLPKTAVLLEAEYSITAFPEATVNQGNDVLMVQAGINGSVTPRLTGIIKVGFGNTFTDGDSFASFVGFAQFGYELTSVSKITMGVRRSVQATSLFSFLATTAASVGYQHEFSEKFQLGASVEGSLLEFGASLADGQTRTDTQISAKLNASYRVIKNLHITVEEKLRIRDSDFVTAVGVASFTTNDFILGVRALY